MAETAPLPRVGELWIQPALILEPGTTLTEAARAMRVRDVSSAVVGIPGAPVAIVTERDLVRAIAESRAADEAVERIATSDPLTVERSTTVLDAATTMLRAGLRHLVVVDDHKVVGVVSMRDLLGALVTSATADSAVVHLWRLSIESPEAWFR